MLKKIWKTCHVNHHNHIIPHPRWKNFNKSDTSWCQRIPWSSRACCPHRPQCWRKSTCMSLMLSYMFQELTKNLSGRTQSQQHITSYVVERFQLKWYLLMSATSLVFSSMLSLPSTVLSTTNSHVHCQTCFQLKRIVTTETTTVYHIPVGKKIPTEVIWFQQLCRSSPPSCLCRLQCRQPPTRMRKSRHVGYPRKVI